MLPQIVRGDVHQLHSVEGAATTPRRSGAVRGLSAEGEYGRNECVAAPAVARAESAAAVIVDDGIDTVEEPGPNHMGPADHRFLGRRPEDLDGSRDVEFIHGFAHGDRRSCSGCAHGVVTAAMTRGPFDEGILFWDPSLLRQHR